MHRLAPLLIIVLIVVAGCSSSGQDRAATAARSVDTATLQAQDLGRHVDAVVNALAPLQSGQGDLKKAYEALTRAATNLETAVASVNTEIKAARSAGDRYAADWEKRLATVTDADIVATSSERLDQLRAGLERLALADSDFTTNATGFTTQLKDLRTALDLDLSVGGVASLRNATAAVIAAAPALKQRAATLADRLQGLDGFLGGN